MSTEEQQPAVARLDEAPEGQASGRAALSIGNAMVQLLSRRAGRGPTKVKTTVTGEFVVVTMRDWLTAAEKSLVDEGHGALVVDARAALSAGMRGEATTVVEEATGRRVAAFLSAHDPDQNLAVMMAVFEQPESLRRA